MNIEEVNLSKVCLIHAQYWRGHTLAKNKWTALLLPSPNQNLSFKNKATRLASANVTGELLDVRRDGNCLYYCMLHFLRERKLIPSS
jgi:hypothetical protein